MSKRFVTGLLAVCILCSVVATVAAIERDSNAVPNYEDYCYFVENMYKTDFNPKNRLYLLSLDAWAEYEALTERASGLIGEELSVKRCTEILANLVTLMNYQLEDAIVEQASIDTTKTLLDYGADLAGIAAGAIGTETLQKGADAVMKRISTVAGITDGFKGVIIDTKEELELLIQLEGDYMMQYDFLETVAMYSDIPEMRDAAQSLIFANNKIMRHKLDTIASVGGSFAKFEAHDVFLDQIAGKLFEDPDFLDTETFPLLAIAKVYEYYSTAKLAFDITLFLGDTLFGTSDTYNRYNEMLAMRDLHNALLARVKANPALHETDYDNMDRNISFMKMALYVDTRGEYCVYKMVTEDGKLLSYFSSRNDKKIEENYQISLNIIRNSLEKLRNMYRTQDMMSLEERYQEYMQLISKYESMYGVAKAYKEDEWFSYMTGLCFIKLVDFDGDGQEELLLVRQSDVNDSWGEHREYIFEVWGYPDNKMVMLDSGELFGTDGGVKSVYLTEYNSNIYLVTGGMDSFGYYCYHGYSNGDFGVVREAEWDYDGEYICSIDGVDVPHEMFEREQEKWLENCVEYNLNYDCEYILLLNEEAKIALKCQA